MSASHGYLTTHVLDTARGCPAAGLKIELYRLDGEIRQQIAVTLTNDDGRTDSPILPADEFATGAYELVFNAGAYLETALGIAADQVFLDVVPIRFVMTEAD